MKEAHERAASTAASSVTPTSEKLIDLGSSANSDVTDVERKLMAERSARQDMEMHVATLNSQRSVYTCVHNIIAKLGLEYKER